MSETNLKQQPLPPRWGKNALNVHSTYMQTEHKYYEIILSRVSLEIFFIKACSSLTPKISNLLSRLVAVPGERRTRRARHGSKVVKTTESFHA